MFWKYSFSKAGIFAVLLAVLCFSNSVSANEFSSKVIKTYETNSFFNLSFPPNFGEEEEEIFELVNKERRKNRLKELNWDDDLAKLARAYSRKMAKESFFSHYDRNGNSVDDRANDAKIRGWKKIGENLFYCTGFDGFSAFAVKGWMKSAGHRRNILNRNFTASGIGIAKSRQDDIYITQVFIEE